MLQRTPHKAFEALYDADPQAVAASVVAHQPVVLRAGVSLVDVRNAEDFARTHLPGAVHTDYQRQVDLLERLPAAPSGAKTLAFVCYAGVRSRHVAKVATHKGFQTWSIAGGITAWRALGLPVVRASDAPLR